ncbi:MAG: hypothetical protein BJ554DRAFT_4642 [Olpidium bornovanus]|uniref:Amino acid transporter transmembrane domain-containing protein n=1 Tax=Olpidium bornovanus TaxID=278681 RepID=A0A8H8A2A2_9FUNG|nr:MAG: hypothetical protein BJ554DRAFT_4642 [Olpidium bornovanus]
MLCVVMRWRFFFLFSFFFFFGRARAPNPHLPLLAFEGDIPSGLNFFLRRKPLFGNPKKQAIRIMETPIFAPRDSVAAAEKVNSIPAAAPPSKRIAAALSSSSGVRGSGRASGKVKWLKNSFRLLVCLATVAVALAGSTDFEKFVNLVGAFACVPLMFIYPAAFHYAAVATTRRHKFMDLALIVVGFISMVFVSAVTIDLWIKESGSSGEHHGIAT